MIVGFADGPRRPLARLQRRSFKAHWEDCDCAQCTDPRTVVDHAHVPMSVEDLAENRTGALLP